MPITFTHPLKNTPPLSIPQNTATPSAWDPWGNPPPLSPFEASPYIPHPTFLSLAPHPYYHPAMGTHYQKMQMLITPGFWPANPRQLSLFYDPVNSPASQQSYHPLLNPLGFHLPNPLDQRPWMQVRLTYLCQTLRSFPQGISPRLSVD